MSERTKILQANLLKLRMAQTLLADVKHVVLNDDTSRFVFNAEILVNEAINKCEVSLFYAEEYEADDTD